MQFFSTGSKTLDLALGGGWAERHIANVIGDSSCGKTLMMIEAEANFLRKHPHGKVRHRAIETFDRAYAAALGVKTDKIDFGQQPIQTIEDLYEEIDYRCSHANQPELFIVDSWDALSSRPELARAIDAASFQAEKAKVMSQLFRRTASRMEQRNITMLSVSQVRSKINAAAWERKTQRSGGKSLQFYCSQVVWLAQVGQVKKTIHGIERTVGIKITALVEKNKTAIPFRKVEFPLLFGYGIDDVSSCIDWLKTNGGIGDALGVAKEKTFKDMAMSGNGDWQRAVEFLRHTVEERWIALETQFLPPRRKYE